MLIASKRRGGPTRKRRPQGFTPPPLTEEQQAIVAEAWGLHGRLRRYFSHRYPAIAEAIEAKYIDFLIFNAPKVDLSRITIEAWSYVMLQWALRQAMHCDAITFRATVARPGIGKVPPSGSLDGFAEDSFAVRTDPDQAIDARTIFEAMPAADRAIVLARYNGATLQDIGESLGVSKERARQLFDRAIDRVRDRYGDNQEFP